MLSYRTLRRWLLVPVLLVCCASAQATEFSTADYDLYPGDFNGDGKTDLLYISKSPDKPSGIALADASGTPQLGFQSWPSNFLNIPWSNGSYKAVVGDFNGDGCTDILLQSQTPGTSYVLLANCIASNGPLGQIQGISQAISPGTLGMVWSADQSHLIAGDFDGDGKTDLFFQATSASGTNAIVLADSSGHLFTRTSGNCWAGGPQQCWTDGYEGIKWSTKSSNIYAGDFNGDHKTDLLVQQKPTFVTIDYDVPFVVPKFAAQAFGIFLALTPDSSGAIVRTPNQLWSVSDLNGKWSPLNSTVVVGDFNGDGYADVLLQSRSGTNMLMLSSSSGQLQSGTALNSALATATSTSYKMIVGKFGGSSIPVLYLQATAAGGTNYITSNASSSSVTETASTMQIVATPTAPATGVGATSGTADVTASGTGTYTIPLSLPRGTANLTPQLTLEYQHSGKNGLVGIGWGLSGLSTVTRCPQTIAQDGVTQGVQFTAADQYCLDGNRLRLTSGTQGADGSQYRTERETYSLIIAHGAGTNGPVWFEVKRKDGMIYEYGNTADSQVSGTAGTRVWALNKMRDRASNYIAYSYFNNAKNPLAACQEQSSQGSYRPCQIVYTGNANQGTSPSYTVQFTYQSRNAAEVLQHMYMGQSITEVNRLLGIQLLYQSSVVKQWKLVYDTTATPSHISRLASVQECGLNSDCFVPTTFQWSNQQFTSGLPTVSATVVTDGAYTNQPFVHRPPWSLDIDGDGVPDTLIPNGYDYPNQPEVNVSVVLQFGTGKGQGSRSSITWNNGSTTGGSTINMSSWHPIGVMDLDGDGKQDFIFVDGTQAQVWWIHQRPDGSVGLDPTPTQELAQPSTYSSVVGLVDVNGDGFPDLISIAPTDLTHLYVTFHNRDGSPGFETTKYLAWTAPTGFQLGGPFVGVPLYAYNSALSAIDVDGDGRQDLLINPLDATGNTTWMVLYSNGSGFNSGDTLGINLSTPPTAVDLNGDGCTDFVYMNSSFNWSVALSKCGVVNGAGLNITATTIPAANEQISVVDFNGDGLQDVVTYNSGPTPPLSAQLLYSLGTTLASPVSVANMGMLWSDRDGDGLPDQVIPGTQGNSTVAGQYQSAVGAKPDLMISVTDAFGNAVTFTYAPLDDPTVYTRGSGATGKTQDLDGSMYVVKQLQSTDGVGGNYSLTYSYTSAHRNVQGRGFLGFANRTVTDSRTGFVTRESYNNTINSDGTGWEFVGSLIERTVQQWVGGPTLQDTLNQWASIAPDSATNRRYPYLNVQTATTYELNNTGAPITTQKTTTTIDNYGTPYDVVTVTTEGSTGINPGSSRTRESYTAPSQVLNDTTNWCLSKPQQTQITGSHTLTNGATVAQSVTQVWDAVNCRLNKRNLDVGSSWESDVQYDYDAWNNIWHQYVSASNLPQTQRTTTFDYSTSTSPGQLLMKVTNALGQQTQFTWDDSRALRAHQTDPNGFVTQWFYDDFGRLARELRPDGTGSRRSYSACTITSNYCGDGLLRYMVQDDERDIHDAIVSYQYAFYDSLGRVKYDETLGFSGALSVVETLYDARGNVASRSMPYYAGTDRYKGTSFNYDLYNRPVSAEQPNSDTDLTPVQTVTVYNGLTVTTSDALGNSHTQVSDGWGDVLQMVDEGGNTTSYTYDGFSRLRTTKDASLNQATYTYTDRGFRLSSSDPDMGTWSYTYDGAGELLSQTDAKSQTTQFHYDALGRADNRTDAGASSPDTLWNWDTAANGIGQLGSVTGPSGYSETYSFDGVGRKIGETVAAAGGTYTLNYGYDPTLGQLQTVTYPTSTSGRFEVLYEYQNGYLKDVKDYNSQTTVFWQAVAQDARGHVIDEQLGNGQQSYLSFDETNGRLNAVQTGSGGGTATQNLNYTWDKVGNLLSRTDSNQGLTEGFTYDSLYRLQTVSLNGAQTSSLTYDALGDISTKSDIGTTSHSYDYTTAQSACSYAGLTTQPHAVRNAGGTYYCYDADGNMTSRGGASVTWYPYNYPQTINQAGGNSSTFYYAPDRSRYRQTSLNGTVTEDRIYVAGLFEKLNSSAVGIEYRHYIVASGEKVAIKVLSASRNDTLYLHSDHLGSTDMITDQTGTVKVHESYDPWGRPRGSNWTGSPSSADLGTINSTTHVGYTAQEHLDNLGLVDLNGRVYDPTIARFVSADPYVQAPYASQSLNRYSYTWNNPLNGTDPSGFCAASRISDGATTSAACSSGSDAQTSGQATAQTQSEVTAFAKAYSNSFSFKQSFTQTDSSLNSAQLDTGTLQRQQQTADQGGSVTEVNRNLQGVTVSANGNADDDKLEKVTISARRMEYRNVRANSELDALAVKTLNSLPEKQPFEFLTEFMRDKDGVLTARPPQQMGMLGGTQKMDIKGMEAIAHTHPFFTSHDAEAKNWSDFEIRETNRANLNIGPKDDVVPRTLGMPNYFRASDGSAVKVVELKNGHVSVRTVWSSK